MRFAVQYYGGGGQAEAIVAALCQIAEGEYGHEPVYDDPDGGMFAVGSRSALPITGTELYALWFHVAVRDDGLFQPAYECDGVRRIQSCQDCGTLMYGTRRNHWCPLCRDPSGPGATSDEIIAEFREFLTAVSSRYERTDPHQSLRESVERVIELLTRRVLENEALLERLDERDAVIEQLRAQVRSLETELRRKQFDTKRARPMIAAIKYVLGGALASGIGGLAFGYAAPAPVIESDSDAEQIVVLCDQILERIPEEAG